MLDDSGNGHHAIPTPGYRAQFVVGLSGKALRIGPNFTVPTLAPQMRPTLTDLTVFTRVKLSAVAEPSEWNRTLLSLGRHTDLQEENGWSLRFIVINFSVFTEINSGVNQGAELADRPPLGQWVDIVTIFDGPLVTTYVNGQRVSHVPYQPAETMTETAAIGSFSPRGVSPFVGRIDDLAVWAGQVPPDRLGDLAPRVAGDGPGDDLSPYVVCAADTPCSPTPAPIARWTFDGHPREARMGVEADEVGDVGYAAGIADGAAEIRSFSGRFEVNGIAPALRATLDDCTVAMWVYPTGRGSGTRYFFVLGSSGGGLENNFWALRTDVRTLEYTFEDLAEDDIETILGVRPPLNVWTHLALTVEDERASLYVNGALHASHALEVAQTDTVRAAIGGWSGANNRSIPGRYDEVRIYGDALSIEQVRQLVAEPAVEDCPASVTDGVCD